MSYMFIRHRVEDYVKWKPIFDEHGGTRKTSGSKGGRLFRNADDPNEVIIIFEWDNLKNAHQFVQSPDLQETMKRAGVSDKPDIYFLEEIDRPSA